MNKTLLATVQNVLSSMDSNDVNSIGDTLESTQIADEAQHTFWDFINLHGWNHLEKLQQLDGLGDTTKPNYLQIPSNVYEIKDIRYDVTETADTNSEFKKIHYLAPSIFLDVVQNRPSSASDVDSVTTFEGITILVKNDEDPHYWTSFDDEYVVFDAYNSDEDATLQTSKNQALVIERPSWTVSDSFEVPLPDHLYIIYVSELRAACHELFKQQRSGIDERRAFRGRARLRHTQAKADLEEGKARYGRNP